MPSRPYQCTAIWLFADSCQWAVCGALALCIDECLRCACRAKIALAVFISKQYVIPMLESRRADSRRRECHFADIPPPSLSKRLLNGEMGAAECQSRRRLGAESDGMQRRQS